ncbi:GxxExxY protein [Patescibacteria group bacterium]|nr:GxxExxY protein [Patescibacteria group bacterium]
MIEERQNTNKVIYKRLSYKIVGVLFDVYNELGYGYQEKYYEKAIEKYFIAEKIKFRRQAPYKISVKNEVIGRYYLDFIIEDKIVLEIKKGNYFSKRNIEQVKGYLKATDMKLAILANFTSNGVKFFRVLSPRNL